MLRLGLVPRRGRPLTLLAIGAHCDDVEIGAGGTLLRLAESWPDLLAHVVILTGTPQREAEARAAAAAFFAPATVEVRTHRLVDGRLPEQWGQVKQVLEDLAERVDPDVVFAPGEYDAHQDHRLLGALVHTSFRDHLVLHYEIPKWDGDLGAGRPTVYVPLEESAARRKHALLHQHFPSQRGRDWFSEDTFLALARLRGLECRAPYAEAFTAPKMVLGVDQPYRATAGDDR